MHGAAPAALASRPADGPTAYFGVFNTVLRHDIGDKKQVRGQRAKARQGVGATLQASWRGTCQRLR